MGRLEATERGAGVCMQGLPLARQEPCAHCPAQPGLPEDPLGWSC